MYTDLSYLKKQINPEFEKWQQMTHWGQIILGPPGSGKTTYCKALSKVLPELTTNHRPVCWVNLDPANDIPKDSEIQPTIDVTELVTLEDVMETTGLGPNGGLLHCMDVLFENKSWLQERLFEVHENQPNTYFLFDIPGQVELSTVDHSSLKKIVEFLTNDKTFDIRLCAVHLVDSIYCNDSSKFLSAVMTSLSTMIHMELPHINVLSKLDLAEKFNPNFNLEFYSDVLDLNMLVDDFEEKNKFLSDSENKKFKKQIKMLTKLSEVIEDYSLVRYVPMTIQSSESIAKVVQACDVANGYFSVEGGSVTSAMGLPEGYQDDYLANLEQQFLS